MSMCTPAAARVVPRAATAEHGAEGGGARHLARATRTLALPDPGAAWDRQD